MSVNRISGPVKYCEIPQVNKMEATSNIDKIYIIYSTLVPPHLKYCGCLQPLAITIGFHLPLSFIFHPIVLYWRGSIYPKSWFVARYWNTYIYQVLSAEGETHCTLNLHTIEDMVIATLQIMSICKSSYTSNNTIEDSIFIGITPKSLNMVFKGPSWYREGGNLSARHHPIAN
jgi:hypothetical protein